jgi:tRNA U38,U39,U40 pseudouridine synthase TruA
MVRNIIGVLMKIATQNTLHPSHIQEVINWKDRAKVFIEPAPAHGLYLQNVYYEDYYRTNSHHSRKDSIARSLIP